MLFRSAIFAVLLLFARVAFADRIDEWAQAEMAAQHIPGMAVGVYRQGKPIKVATYGFADLENTVRVTDKSLFEIGSVSKQFTAAGILLLEQDGKLGLDDRVAKFLPEWPAAWGTVTLWELLHHTSGLNDDNFLPADLPLEEILKPMLHNLISLPGEEFEYSNMGYRALARVIEAVSGGPYYAFIQERILDKLQMSDTHPNFAKVIAHRVRGYSWDGFGYVNQAWHTAEQGLGDGGLISTIGDLNRWSEALKHDELLSTKSRAEMLEPGRLSGGEIAWPEGMGEGYGLGVFLGGTPGHRLESHSGSWAGSSAQLSRFLDDDLTVVILTNKGAWENRPWAGETVASLLDPKLEVQHWVAMGDPDPVATGSVSSVLADLAIKQFPKAALSERLTHRISVDPDEWSGFARRLDPTRLQFVERVPQGPGWVSVYRMEYPTPQIVYAVFDGTGRISNFRSFPIQSGG